MFFFLLIELKKVEWSKKKLNELVQEKTNGLKFHCSYILVKNIYTEHMLSVGLGISKYGNHFFTAVHVILCEVTLPYHVIFCEYLLVFVNVF